MWCSIKIQVGDGYRFKRKFSGKHISDGQQGQFLRDAQDEVWGRLSPQEQAEYKGARALPHSQPHPWDNDPGENFEKI